MEGTGTSRGPSEPSRKVIINAQKLFKVLHGESISSQDKLKQITEIINGDDMDVNFPDEQDDCNTLLHGAVAYGYVDIVRLILYKKKVDVSEHKVGVNVQRVNVNIQNAKGETPLHLVLSDRRINRNKCGKPIVQMLLGCKADVNIKNSAGKTLLDMAKEKREEALIAILEGNQVQKVTDTCASSSETYVSSGAKNSMHGTVYQLRLLMLFAIRALVMGYRFHLGTEVDEAEQFDDLVFKYRLSNTDLFKKLLLQAKSKANCNKGISFEELLDEDNKAQFSLLKYYKSFIKIRELGQEAEEFDFVICTNTHFNFGETGVLIGSGKKLSFKLVTDICAGFFKEGQCYKLVTDEETLDWLKIDFDQKWNKEKIKLGPNDTKNEEYDYYLSCLNDTHLNLRGTFRIFLNKLVFVVGQTADMEVIKTEFREYSKINHPDTKLHTDAFYKQIFDWFSQKEGVWLTNEMVEEMIGSICDNAFATSLSQVYVETSRTSNIKFNIGKLDELNKRISENKIVNLITPMETKLTLLQVAQALECSPAYKGLGFIFIHFSTLLLSETQERTIRAFKSPRNNNLLVIDCLSEKKDTSSGNLTTLQEALWNITAKNIAKKIILLTPENHGLSEVFRSWPGYYSQHVKHVFNDFKKKTQDVFLTTKVKFQGQRIELSKIIGETETELLQIVPLETLIGGDELVIGKDLPTDTGYNELYYIDRSVRYKTVVKADIFEATSREKFCDKVANSEPEFQHMCATHTDANIHLIEKQGDTFIWVKSQGNLTELRPYFDNDTIQTCSEEQFLDLVKRQRVVIISDSAGMGKSMILTHMSKIIQTEYQGTLILRIDLNKHTKALKEQREKSTDNMSFMDYLLEFLMITTPFEKALMKRNGKAIWKLDGFDEISPTYNKTVLDFIKYLVKATKGQIWITTRPFMAKELENELHQRSYTLKAFSKANQIDFLTKYWKHMNTSLEKPDEDRLTIFAQSIIQKFSGSISDKEKEFTGIPLQMRMLAECFKDDVENALDCENSFNLVDLYDKFIKKKLTVFNVDKNKIDLSTVGAIEELEEKIEEYEEYHRRIALKVIFPENKDLLLLPAGKIDINSSLSRTEMKLNRIGVVNIMDGKPHFIHRTFAEYFVAAHLMNTLKQMDRMNTKEQDFIFVKLLVSEEYKVIRVFLNGLLAKIQPFQESPKGESKKLHEAHQEDDFSNENEYRVPSFKQASLTTAREGNGQLFLYMFNYSKAYYPTIIQNLLQCTAGKKTMLHLAIINNDTLYIKTLLQWTLENTDQGQKIVKKMLFVNNNGTGETALSMAISEGHNDVVQTLLQWTRDNMNHGQEIVKQMLLVANNTGGTALSMALVVGHNAMVQTLLQWTRDNMNEGQQIVKQMFLAADYEGNTALMCAAASNKGYNYMVQTLLQWTRDNVEQGQDIVKQMLLAINKHGSTALMRASNSRKGYVFQTLLQWTLDNMDHGQEIVKIMLLAADNDGETALMCASRNDRVDALAFVGASMNGRVDQLTILQWILDNMEQGQEILKQMLLAGDNKGKTALMCASESDKGYNYMVQTLLQWTHDNMNQGQEIVKQMLLATDNYGNTALMWASKSDNYMAQTLLQWTRDNMEQGQDIVKQLLLAINQYGWTALMRASNTGKGYVFRPLLQWTLDNMDHGQDILKIMMLATDSNGKTALMGGIRYRADPRDLAMNGRFDELNFLQWTLDNMEQGQEIVKQMLLIADNKGKTALIWASYYGYKNKVQGFLQWPRDKMEHGQEIVKQMLLAADDDGNTVLILASRKGGVEVAQMILQWTIDNMEHGQEIVRIILLAANNDDETALITLLMRFPAWPQLTLLQWTLDNVDQGQEMVKEMLIDTFNPDKAALMWASYYGYYYIVQSLLPWTRDNMENGQEIVKQMLLAADEDGNTQLILTTCDGGYKVQQTLLQWTRDNMEQGQEIAKQMLIATNKNGNTALMCASSKGHNYLVRTLLQWTRDNMEHGQEIVKQLLFVTNNDGDTALIMASKNWQNKKQTILQWTLDNMVQGQEIAKQMLLATDNHGNTALQEASALQGGHLVVENLLQWTRDNMGEEILHEMLTARNKTGRTALDLAEEALLHENVEILKKYARHV